jgi:hypothetical protein
MRFLPLFPLKLVIYPGEIVNLHIFEPRYKQLVSECLENKFTFGVPTYLNNNIPGYGTEVEIIVLVKDYDNGEKDITVKGKNIFKIVNFYKKVLGKLYSGSDIEDSSVSFDSSNDLKKDVLKKMQELFRFAGLDKKIKFNPEQHVSYLIAHTVGLTLEQEYELLTIPLEEKRLSFISEHLSKILPIVQEFEKLKEKIKMNGHFKNFPKIDFP